MMDPNQKGLTITIYSAWKKGRRKIQSWHDLWLLTRIAGLIIILPLLLRLIKLPQLLDLLATSPNSFPHPRKVETEKKIVNYTCWLLNRNFWVFRNVCLKRCLVLYRFLGEVGLEPKISFGIKRTDDGDLLGHSWLQVNGKIYLDNEKQVKKYTSIYKGA